MSGRREQKRSRTTLEIASALLVIGVGALIIRHLSKAPRTYKQPHRKPTRREKAQVCKYRHGSKNVKQKWTRLDSRSTGILVVLTSPLLSIPDITEKPWRRDLTQTQSLLFSLPLELRQMIYRLCFEPFAEHGEISFCQGANGRRLKIRLQRADFSDTGPRRGQGILQLPMTCRRMYTDTIDMLYSLFTFSFTHPGPLNRFIAVTIPERKVVIKRLHFVFEFPYMVSLEKMPEALTTMMRATTEFPALNELRIRLAPVFGFHMYPKERKREIGRLLVAFAQQFDILSVVFQVPWVQKPPITGPFRIETYQM